VSQTHRRFRFAVGAPFAIPTRRALVDHARFAESAGFEVATFPDHFFLPLAPLIALVTVAEATERLRVGPLMLANGLRQPAVLAKELASVDLLTSGRLEVGIGAGWIPDDFAAIGVEMETPRTRIRRLSETIDILKGIWTSDRFGYEGALYRVAEISCLPAPAQQGGPPLLIGGGGRSILSLAAARADMVSIAAGPIGAGGSPGSPQALTERTAWIDEVNRATGRDPERHLLISAVIEAQDRRQAASEFVSRQPAAAAIVRSGPVEEAEVLKSPFVLLGTKRDMAEQLRDTRERWGISYFSVMESAARNFAPVMETVLGS
jgi:probable F420-dependent oxidoreductase